MSKRSSRREHVVTGTGWDIWAKVPWTAETIKVQLLPNRGIEVRWTEPGPREWIDEQTGKPWDQDC